MTRETPDGLASVALLCAAFGISRAAYYAAGKAHAVVAKVLRLPRAPRFTSAEVVLAAIRAILAREAAWGVRKVWATLRQDGLRVSRRRVWALMQANGLCLARDREPGETTRGHVAVPEPNRRWATDMTTAWTKRDGVVAIVPTIDCGCRSVLGMVVGKSQDAPALLSSVEEALTKTFGTPTAVPLALELRTDHGPQYTGSDCEAMCTEWKLLHTYAPVGRPTGNAVVERVIRTLKEEVVWLRDWENADELRAALEAWVIRDHERRPHQALAYRCPTDFRAERLAAPLAVAA
jgi:putative transposase